MANISFEGFTENFTQKEISFRDNFWGPKIPKYYPSPNFLTAIRIVGSIFLFFSKLNSWLFFLIAIFLFSTDYFDGIIARTQNKETIFGKWADPLADKLLLAVAVYFLYLKNIIFWQPLFIKMLIPELIIVLLILIGAVIPLCQKLIIPKPLIWGRLKFTCYFLGILFFLVNYLLISNFLIILGIAFAYLAFISYAIRACRDLNIQKLTVVP